MINNKIIIPVMFVTTTGLMSGCENFDIDLVNNNKYFDYAFTQTSDDTGFIGSEAAIKLYGPGEKSPNYDHESDRKAWIVLDSESFLIESVAGSDLGSISFATPERLAGTTVEGTFTKGGTAKETALFVLLPQIPMVITPATNSTFAPGDVIDTEWQVVDGQPVGSVSFISDCLSDTGEAYSRVYSYKVGTDTGLLTLAVYDLEQEYIASESEILTTNRFTCDLSIEVSRTLTDAAARGDSLFDGGNIYATQKMIRRGTITFDGSI